MFMLDFLLTHYKNFNARSTRDATLAYWRHIRSGGRMFWAMAGAMSSAQLGITLAPAIRAGLVHGLSVTGANLEESLFRLVAHDHYKDFPEYRYFTKADDTRILNDRMRRVTDTSIPEDEAFRAVEKYLVPMWKNASAKGERRFWHEYFYELVTKLDKKLMQGDPQQCWLLAAAKANLPIVVPGYEDSTFGNIFASHVKFERLHRRDRQERHRVHGRLLRPVQGNGEGQGRGLLPDRRGHRG
jgi:deoxyhypusine synthase